MDDAVIIAAPQLVRALCVVALWQRCGSEPACWRLRRLLLAAVLGRLSEADRAWLSEQAWPADYSYHPTPDAILRYPNALPLALHGCEWCAVVPDTTTERIP